jgi:hypothetical protein
MSTFMRARKWSDRQLVVAVKKLKSTRAVIGVLGLIPAGGNYQQVKKRIQDLNLDTSHFLGMGWCKGMSFDRPSIPIESILVENSSYQSFKLKKRLFLLGLKQPRCEECKWAKKSIDGRIPLELDHINGNRTDNRIENLRVLCPNCHSLKPTHRGKNKGRKE